MKGKKHILVISQYFYPESFRINDIATEWVKQGYKVTVVTGIPNYPQGEYYEGYSKTERTNEEWNGMNVIRLPIEPRKTGAKNLIRNYLSFVILGRTWIKKTDVNADIVFTFEVSPMIQALVSVWYAKKNHIPHILYVTDLWPENVEIITGIHNRFILGSIQMIVDYIYKNSTRILTCSNSFVKAIRKRNITADKIEFWPQYAEDFYKPVDRVSESEIPNDGILNLIFAGNIGYAQGLGILPTAAQKLKQDEIIIRFIIIGDGRYLPVLKQMTDRLQVRDYFKFIDRKPAEEIPAYLAAADALLITLSRSEVFSITIPAKTQSCLACGRPVLVSADGEVQQIIRNANAGLASNAEDVEGFVKNIKFFSIMEKEKREELGINALKYSKEYFDKGKLLARMEEILQRGDK